MSRINHLFTVLMAALLVTSMIAVPVAAQEEQTPVDETSDEDLSPGLGAQISTIVAVTGDEVEADVEDAQYKYAFERANESEQARLATERAHDLASKSKAVKDEFKNATKAYKNGEITDDQYAQRLAVLSERAESLDKRSSEHLTGLDRAREVANENAAFGLEQAAKDLKDSQNETDDLKKPGARAVAGKFMGEDRGEVAISKVGNSIAIAARDNENTSVREFVAEGDNSTAMNMSLAEAMALATSSLDPVANASWELTEMEKDVDDGVYEFEFELNGTDETEGEAEIVIDASARTIVDFSEEIESEDGDHGAKVSEMARDFAKKHGHEKRPDHAGPPEDRGPDRGDADDRDDADEEDAADEMEDDQTDSAYNVSEVEGKVAAAHVAYEQAIESGDYTNETLVDAKADMQEAKQALVDAKNASDEEIAQEYLEEAYEAALDMMGELDEKDKTVAEKEEADDEEDDTLPAKGSTATTN